MARSRSIRLALAACLAMALALVAPSAHAEPADLYVEASLAQGTVRIEGSLTNERGRAVRSAPLLISINGQPSLETLTRGNGSFRATFDASQFSTPTLEIVVTFAGASGLDPAEASTTLELGAPSPPPPDPTTPPPTATPDPTPSATPTTATPAPSATEPSAPAGPPKATIAAEAPGSAQNGEQIVVAGTLVDSTGRGITAVGVTVSGPAGSNIDGYAVTGDGGAFSVPLTIPVAHASGQVNLTVEFDGAGTYQPVTQTLPLSVTFVQPAAPTPSAGASTDPSPDPAAPTQSTVAPTPTPTVSGGNTVATQSNDDGQRESWNTMMIVFALVAAFAVVVAATLAFRGLARRRAGGTEALDFFDPEDDDALDEGVEGLFSEPDVDPEPPAAPRRGAPD